MLARRIRYTSGAGGRQLAQTRSETIAACSPTGSTDTTRSPSVGRPVTGSTLPWSRSTTYGLGSRATSSRSRVRPANGTPASGRPSPGAAVVEDGGVEDGDARRGLGPP